MNEVDWLGGADPAAMLDYLEGKASDRKLRLFACACARRYWHLLVYTGSREEGRPTDNTPRQAVALAERHAEGLAGDDDLEEVRGRAEMAAMLAPDFQQPAWQAAWATTLEVALDAARQAREFARLQAVREAAYSVAPWENEARINAEASAAECRGQADLLREVFGNPYRSVKVEPVWLSAFGGAGTAILQAVDEEERFEELPYLGDALMDAGCGNEELLRHLREPRGHVRGCWAVDLLLGRE
jgi:hypothetical protein